MDQYVAHIPKIVDTTDFYVHCFDKKATNWDILLHWLEWKTGTNSKRK